MNPMDKKLQKQRQDRNADLLRRMQRGDNLMLSSTEDTFFPKRPVIKKDLDVISKLYKLKRPPSK